MADFDYVYKQTEKNEGGYVYDPDDSGGETYKGISRVIWGIKYPEIWKRIDSLKASPHFQLSLENDGILQDLIKEFYLKEFWNPIRGAEFNDKAVALTIYDFAVNAGVSTSKELARIAAGLDIYDPEQINQMLFNHFMSSFALAKIARYIHICNKKQKNKKFFFGWIVRAMSIKYKN